MSATNLVKRTKKYNGIENNKSRVCVINKTVDGVVNLPLAFTSLIAHEIRNPLMNINLSAGLLELNTTSTEDKEYLDIIKRSCVKINLLVTTFIKEQKKIKESKSIQFVQEIIDDILENSADRILLKHVAVTKTYSSEDIKISKNVSKIKIALTNIIVNAIDAMPFERGALQIMTKLTNGKYLVYIKDNGCGIKKENLDKIFLLFYTNKSNGLGVGLSLSYNILTANNVQIKVESEEYCGTCFTLTFNNYQTIGFS